MLHHRPTNITGVAQVDESESGGDFRSMLECDRFSSMVVRPDVVYVGLNKPTISYVAVDGRKTRYTPDLSVRFALKAQRRPLMIECKYSTDLVVGTDDTTEERAKKELLVAKHARLKEVYDALGFEFEVHTEAEVYGEGTRMARFVFSYINIAEDKRENEILSAMDRIGACSLRDLLEVVRPGNLYEQLTVVPFVWKLVARRRLETDFKVLLNDDAVLHAV